MSNIIPFPGVPRNNDPRCNVFEAQEILDKKIILLRAARSNLLAAPALPPNAVDLLNHVTSMLQSLIDLKSAVARLEGQLQADGFERMTLNKSSS